MMDLFEDLLSGAAMEILGTYDVQWQGQSVSLAPGFKRMTMAEAVKEYLGVDVPDDASGCLQDVHWSGSYGYFPSYALGSAYGAQILHTMQKELDVFGLAAKGDLLPIRDWLKEHVFSIASVSTPDEWIRAITGESLNVRYFLDYLEQKFSALYAL